MTSKEFKTESEVFLIMFFNSYLILKQDFEYFSEKRVISETNMGKTILVYHRYISLIIQLTSATCVWYNM